MLKKSIALALFTTVITLTVSFYNRSVAQSDIITSDTLTSLAQEAIARGESEVSSSLSITFNEATSLDAAFARDTLIVGTPLVKKSYVVGNQSIDTWYKFRFNETLQQKTIYASVDDAPSDMLPLAADEFLVVVPGGEQFIDGVLFTLSVAQFPSFTTNQKYLLFLNYDASKRVGTIGGGPTAIYTVVYPDTLASIFVDSDGMPIGSPVGDGLYARFGNSLNQLRNTLNPPPPPPACDPDGSLEQDCNLNGGSWNFSTCHCSVSNPCSTSRPWLCDEPVY
jgi:hypothetical protein